MKTMIDVAELAGVSQATVSRVVNGDPRVAEPTVQAVTRAMRELGYEARPRRKKSREIGGGSPPGQGVVALLLLDASMDTHPAMALAKLRGVEAATSHAGLTLAVTRMREDGELPPTLMRPDLAGVLLWGSAVSPRLAPHIQNLPHLWLSSHTTGDDNVVLVGNEQAGRLAAEYLLERGIHHPAALYPLSTNPQYELRIDGFRYGCHIRGRNAMIVRSAESTADVQEDVQEREIRYLVEQLVSVDPVPDGLFVPDDSLTALVYPLLTEHGIRPEKDIRIVSCDNESTYLNALHPRPATIDLAPEATGRLAVEQLLRRLSGPGDDGQVSMLINPRLILGSRSQDEKRVT
jgi:DNA-binding LacI/PurR family transcriptional regulator